MVKLFKKEKETPVWAEAAQYADRIKELCENINDATYLIALKSIVDRLQKTLEKRIQQLEKRSK